MRRRSTSGPPQSIPFRSTVTGLGYSVRRVQSIVTAQTLVGGRLRRWFRTLQCSPASAHWAKSGIPETGPARPAVGGPMEEKPVYLPRSGGHAPLAIVGKPYATFEDRSRPASLNGPVTELDNSKWRLLPSRACHTYSHDVRRHHAVSARRLALSEPSARHQVTGARHVSPPGPQRGYSGFDVMREPEAAGVG